MRHACLDGVRLISDRQPTQNPGGPSIHPARPQSGYTQTAAAWPGSSSTLASEPGCNSPISSAMSWATSWPIAGSRTPSRNRPCQWLEEALVEAFTLRGLGRLAESWKTNPPFRRGQPVRRGNCEVSRRISGGATIGLLRRRDLPQTPQLGSAKHRKEIEVSALNPFAQAASLKVLAEYEQAPNCVEALGALNRWPGRTGVPIEEYFRQWEASCAELQANPQLPRRLREMWRIGQRQRVGRPALRRSSAR